MAGRKRGTARGRGVALRAEAAQRRTRASTRSTRSSARQADVPDIYFEMLAESGALSNQMTSDATDRPLKRRRTERWPAEGVPDEPTTLKPEPRAHTTAGPSKALQAISPSDKEIEEDGEDGEDEEEDIVFEDVELRKPNVQTTYRDSSDDESEEDMEFEDVDFETIFSKREEIADEGTGTLELNLTAAREALTPFKRNADRRKPISKAEKERRVEVHRMHLLCLLAHVEKRNHWCNDPVVQETLRTLLPAKTVQLLNPGSNLTQFGQTESLKRGLEQAEQVFRQRFAITERGLRRALWAENEEHLENYHLPQDIETCLDKTDFRKAAKKLEGSRDVGAQLFCALLRGAGVETRLVCSLQPLSPVPGGPTLPKPCPDKTSPKPAPVVDRVAAAPTESPASASRPSPRARLGHPNATAYHVPDISAPHYSISQRSPTTRRVSFRESPYPIYWVEVLDAAHQKWQPVDALVTGTHFRPGKLEPPAADRENALSYAIAFEEDGTAKDVTRRYAKAYNSKTRRTRIDGPNSIAHATGTDGTKWWLRALRRYKRPGGMSDLDQIENNELNAAEAREPMPRNVVDFKDHPIYALERHLRRHEVLIPGASVVGTVSAGSKGPLEKIYRRKDVRVARSADKWYRMGREIKLGEEPVKVLPKRRSGKRRGRLAFSQLSEDESSEDDPVLGPSPGKGISIYTFDQTQLYVPPPVVAGRIPKNRFGNLDVYVPSMIPAGGARVVHPRAAHAAYVLGIDYAPALTGFDWKGRKGTAVYKGVVVPSEAEEAVRAVIAGFEDLEVQLEEERRSRRALATWKKWLRSLRIRRRVFGDEAYGDDAPLEDFVADDAEVGTGEESDREAGGFMPGGFESEGFEPGGFEPAGFEGGGFEPSGFGVDHIPGKGEDKEGQGFDHNEYEREEDQHSAKVLPRQAALLDDSDGDSDDAPLVAPRWNARRLRGRQVVDSENDDDEDNTVAGGLEVDDARRIDGAGGFMVDIDGGGSPEQTHNAPGMADSLVNEEEIQGDAGPSGSVEGGGFEVSIDTAEPPEQSHSVPETTGDLASEEREVDPKPDSVEPGGFLVELDGPGVTGSVLPDADSEAMTGDQEPDRSAQWNAQVNDHGARVDSEDAELEDAPSDVTEELFMDDDGFLVE